VTTASDVRVFMSFDVDHDADLGDRLLTHSKMGGSGFNVASRSESGAITERWRAGVRRRVREADEVIVICGEHTAESQRMNTEMRIAREERKPCLLLWGRRERKCLMPVGVERSACMYSWTWDVLVFQVAQTMRVARPPEIPQELRRTPR
jgi:antiphage defense system Thoeris ThsB-like protein